MSYADAGHRPHAIHTGETPRNEITHGPESISVTLDTWGPRENIFPAIYDALQSNWGDEPSRTVGWPHGDRYDFRKLTEQEEEEHVTGWSRLNDDRRAYVESAFAGKTLPQILEGIEFHFLVNGVTRAFTHQTVRNRIGSAFMQHGGRDNDWRHRPWTMPETIRRACQVQRGHAVHGITDETHKREEGVVWEGKELKTSITDWKPIDKLLNQTPVFNGDESYNGDPTLEAAIKCHLLKTRELYAALVDAGIPWQDARRLLPIGLQTYIHEIWNYLALQNMLSKRLEFVMDWEHVCVAQLMVREVNMKCPPIFGKYLQSISDKTMRAAFSGLESWPPDMKHDPMFPCECGHAKANHHDYQMWQGGPRCEVCGETEGTCQGYIAKDPLPRTHRAEQNPFFVLHPDSMAGGPVKWVATNGTYPTEF